MSAAPIDKPAELAALRACGTAAMQAADGRGVRGARVACINALVRAGHTYAGAEPMAFAMAVFAYEFGLYADASLAHLLQKNRPAAIDLRADTAAALSALQEFSKLLKNSVRQTAI